MDRVGGRERERERARHDRPQVQWVSLAAQSNTVRSAFMSGRTWGPWAESPPLVRDPLSELKAPVSLGTGENPSGGLCNHNKWMWWSAPFQSPWVTLRSFRGKANDDGCKVFLTSDPSKSLQTLKKKKKKKKVFKSCSLEKLNCPQVWMWG